MFMRRGLEPSPFQYTARPLACTVGVGGTCGQQKTPQRGFLARRTLVAS